MEKNNIDIGDKVKDPISGIIGIVVTISRFLTGCERCSIQQEGVNKITGKPYEWIAFDVPALEIIKKNKIISKPTKNGGPRDMTPKY